MMKITTGLLALCLVASSCDEWRAVPTKIDLDQSQEPVVMSGKGKQNYISMAEVRFSGDALIPRNMVHIALADGRSKWQYDTDFEVQTMMSGVLTMDFTIKATDGAMVSEGRISWPLKPDCRLSIFIERSSHTRRNRHWGWSGSKSFPIVNPRFKTSEDDAIIVSWGGNSISNPRIY